jgi:hypothetical protein
MSWASARLFRTARLALVELRRIQIVFTGNSDQRKERATSAGGNSRPRWSAPRRSALARAASMARSHAKSGKGVTGMAAGRWIG